MKLTGTEIIEHAAAIVGNENLLQEHYDVQAIIDEYNSDPSYYNPQHFNGTFENMVCIMRSLSSLSSPLDEWQMVDVAENLLERHHLKGWELYPEEEWSIVINNNKRRLGYCSYAKKQIRLSRELLSNHKIALNTIHHEIAHAIAGPKAGHGRQWKEIAVSLGAEPKSTIDRSDSQWAL